MTWKLNHWMRLSSIFSSKIFTTKDINSWLSVKEYLKIYMYLEKISTILRIWSIFRSKHVKDEWYFISEILSFKNVYNQFKFSPHKKILGTLLSKKEFLLDELYGKRKNNFSLKISNQIFMRTKIWAYTQQDQFLRLQFYLIFFSPKFSKNAFFVLDKLCTDKIAYLIKNFSGFAIKKIVWFLVTTGTLWSSCIEQGWELIFSMLAT